LKHVPCRNDGLLKNGLFYPHRSGVSKIDEMRLVLIKFRGHRRRSFIGCSVPFRPIPTRIAPGLGQKGESLFLLGDQYRLRFGPPCHGQGDGILRRNTWGSRCLSGFAFAVQFRQHTDECPTPAILTRKDGLGSLSPSGHLEGAELRLTPCYSMKIMRAWTRWVPFLHHLFLPMENAKAMP
jgi:hypothetical protein